MLVGFAESPGVPTTTPTVAQFSLATPVALIQFAVGVFRTVPTAELATVATIVIVSVSALAIELNVTVTSLPLFVQTPFGVLEQLLKVS